MNNLHKVHQIREKICSSHPEKIFEQMPTLEDFLSNIDNQTHYQGVTLKNLECEKEYLERNMSCIIQDIVNVLSKDMVI